MIVTIKIKDGYDAEIVAVLKESYNNENLKSRLMEQFEKILDIAGITDDEETEPTENE
jgi:hypothetical protein